jgi:polyisoprenoid-binding protein YceI
MTKWVIAIVAVIVVLAVGLVAYSFLREPEAATGPIEAIPIAAEVEDVAAESGAGSEEPAQTDAAPAEDPTTPPETQVETAPPPEPPQPDEATVVPAESAQSSEETGGTSGIFEIVSAESEARFLIDEVLRGDPVTVVGSTDQVAGQIAVDPGDLSSAQAGIIQVNARTLATDNQFRNRAIKNRILLTNDHEFVTFAPTEIVGLDGSGVVGETYSFQIVGDLTVTDVTRQVTFEVTATPVSETRIEGLATTAFLYTDFELFIPDAQAVDTVEDEVRLEFEFVAEATQ